MIFAFFGHPGAGKTTLAARFAALHGLQALDTDRFMTAEERAAVPAGQYTQAMRLANIERYCRYVRELDAPGVALADGLPNDAARRFLLAQFPAGQAVLVLVTTPPAIWRERLGARAGNPVSVSVAEAEAYIRDHWQPVGPDLPHEIVDNGAEAASIDEQLLAIVRRHAG